MRERMMERLIRGLQQLGPHHRRAVVVMGNFDGVHLGHQLLLRRGRVIANRLKRPLLVILFEPQPKEFQMMCDAPPRLFHLREKYFHLRALGVDYILCLRFDQFLQKQKASQFIERTLIGTLDMKHIVLSITQRFGYKREGGVALLKHYAKQGGFGVTDIEVLSKQGIVVNSTYIRELLKAGQLKRASLYLGKPYAMIGPVERGSGRGRDFGAATANFNPERQSIPLHGVYVVQVRLCPITLVTALCDQVQNEAYPLVDLDSIQPYWGIANIGYRPTIAKEDVRCCATRCRLEAHLFDFSGNIYDQWLQVCFTHFLRQEQCFDTIHLLKQQISSDVHAAKAWIRLKGQSGF